jgi:hypothetical protein
MQLFLQVTEDDKLPKIMCGECSYKLDLLSDFREKALETAIQLLSEVEVKTEVLEFLIAPFTNKGKDSLINKSSLTFCRISFIYTTEKY